MNGRARINGGRRKVRTEQSTNGPTDRLGTHRWQADRSAERTHPDHGRQTTRGRIAAAVDCAAAQVNRTVDFDLAP
jgi:hypothetical protein